MKTTHTPGPWKIALTGHVVTAADYSRICHIEPLPGMDSSEIAANARLIAAAPDVLKALREAAEFMIIARQRFPKSVKNSDKFTLELTNAAIGSAIHKATGIQD